ncbi:unnamed protein product [Cladocopium goreaui]|uniref:Ubiquitin-like domain-containing protein n=1 Tax=Cladocopium goreaui TaxID=2562237 RepID=A0A9P1DFG2_9DINO|nr:unnamed protein product [Cladocopium goreaui]
MALAESMMNMADDMERVKQLATRDVDECNECDTDEELDSREAEANLPAVATAIAESPGSPGSPGLPGSPGDRGSGVMKEAKEGLVRTGLMALEAQSDDELLGLAPRSQPTRRQNKTWQLEEEKIEEDRRAAEEALQAHLEERRQMAEDEAALAEARRAADQAMKVYVKEERRRIAEAEAALSEARRAALQAQLEERRIEEARVERESSEEAFWNPLQAQLEEERKRFAQEAAREQARRATEEARLEEERRRLAEEAAQEEARRIAEEERLEEERKRLAEEEAAREQARRAAEEARLEEERRRLAEEAAQEEARRIAEEERLEEERKRLAEEEAAREQARRAAEEARLEEERRRLAEEEAAQEEARRIAEEERLEEERKRLAEEEAAREQARRAAEEARLEEERRRLAEEAAQEEARRIAEEERLEEERKRLAEEEAAREQARRAAEEAAQEEARRIAEEERLEEERKRLAEEEAGREQAIRAAEEARLEEERRRLAEEAAQEEARRIAEEERLEEERKRLAEEEAGREQAIRAAEEARLEEERRRLAEEAAQEEARRIAEEERLEEERKRLAEEEAGREQAIRAAEEARLEEERRRLAEEAAQEEARRIAEEERLEEERKRLAEEEAAQEEARRIAEEERLEEERKRLAEEEAAREQARRAAEEARLEEERRRLAEEAAQEEARRIAEEERLEEERKRLAEEEAAQEEARRIAEEERLEEERKRLAEEEAAREQARRAAEEARLEEERRRLAEEAAQEEARRIAEEVLQQGERLEEERRRLAEEEASREQARRAAQEDMGKEFFTSPANTQTAEAAQCVDCDANRVCSACSRALQVFCALATGTREVPAIRTENVWDCGGGATDRADPCGPCVPCPCVSEWPTALAMTSSNWATTRTSLLALAAPPGDRKVEELKSRQQDTIEIPWGQMLERGDRQPSSEKANAMETLESRASSPAKSMLNNTRSPWSDHREAVESPRSLRGQVLERGDWQPSSEKANAMETLESRASSPAKSMLNNTRSPWSDHREAVESPRSLRGQVLERGDWQPSSEKANAMETLESRASSPAKSMPRSIAANFLTFQESEPRVVPESPRLVPSPVNSSVVARRLRQKVYGLRGSASAKGLSAVEAEAEVQGASPEGLVSVHFPMRKRHHGKAVKGRFEKTWQRTQAKLAQRHGKTFEWPDLCISSCIEGLDGAPAFNLAWGASDLTRHHAISRQPDLIVFPPDRDVGLELQCMPLAAHDVTVAADPSRGQNIGLEAFSDLSWQSLCSAGVGQVLYAIGPPTLFASVEKCVTWCKDFLLTLAMRKRRLESTSPAWLRAIRWPCGFVHGNGKRRAGAPLETSWSLFCHPTTKAQELKFLSSFRAFERQLILVGPRTVHSCVLPLKRVVDKNFASGRYCVKSEATESSELKMNSSSSQSFQVDDPQSKTVGALKQQLFADALKAQRFVRFIAGGRILEDTSSLDKCNLGPESHIHVSISGKSQNGAQTMPSAAVAQAQTSQVERDSDLQECVALVQKISELPCDGRLRNGLSLCTAKASALVLKHVSVACSFDVFGDAFGEFLSAEPTKIVR